MDKAVNISASVQVRAVQSAIWAAIQNGGKHVLTFAVFVALARVLGPEAYGILAFALALITLCNIFVEQGLGDALVQREHIEEAHYSSAFWINLAAGLVATLIVYFAADRLAVLLGHAEVAAVLRGLSGLFVLNALTCVPQARLQRALAFRTLALRTLASVCAGGAVGVWMAYNGFGLWSLVAQQLVSAGCGVIVLWAGSRWLPKGGFSIARARELLRFSRHMIGVSLLDFLNRKTDDLIIGIFLGPVALGVYNVAYQVLVVLEQLLCKGFDAIALSWFSRLQSDKAQLRSALYEASEMAAVFAFPAFIGAMLVAPEAVPVLLGSQWSKAVPVVQILAGAGLLHSVFHYNHAVFRACGQPQLSVRLGGIEAIANVPIFLLAVQWGIEAVAAAYVLRAYLLAPLCLAALRKLIGISRRDYLLQLAAPLAASLCMAGIVIALGRVFPEEMDGRVRLALLILAGIAAYPAWLRVVRPELFRRRAGASGLFAAGRGKAAVAGIKLK